MDCYEYKTLSYETRGFSGGKIDTETVSDELSALGAQGWRVIKCFTTAVGSGGTHSVFFLLERKR